MATLVSLLVQVGRRAIPSKATVQPVRYANVELRRDAAWVRPQDVVAPGDIIAIRVGIGPLKADSAVAEPEPFPEPTFIQEEQIPVEILLSSADFGVAGLPEQLRGFRRHNERERSLMSATAGLTLPSRGGAASGDVEFYLCAPDRLGPGRARLSYYYRGAVIQSQRIDITVGGRRCGATVTTDFTTSADLIGLQSIPDRPRVAIVVNDGPRSSHRVQVRVGSQEPTDSGEEFAVNTPALTAAIDQLRRRLGSEGLAPTTLQRSRHQLIEDLRRLAPLGWQLHAAFATGASDAAYSLDTAGPGDVVVHVCRAGGSDLTLPWSLLYRHRLPVSEDEVGQVRVCPLVGEWDGRSPLVDGAPRVCPAEHADEEILCPFGFWGFRHTIEVLNPSQRPRLRIDVPPNASVAVIKTLEADQAQLTQHVADLRGIVAGRFPGVTVLEGVSKRECQKLLTPDQPLVYFYCHGNLVGGRRVLAVGRNESIAWSDVVGWVQSVNRQQHRRMWTDPLPLIFINACVSVEVGPKDLAGYLDAFVGAARASGVIGTEAKVEAGLAAEFARRFFTRLIGEGATVESALHQTRADFLAHGNLLGLVYTPYCWADLALTPTLQR